MGYQQILIAFMQEDDLEEVKGKNDMKSVLEKFSEDCGY